MLIDRAGPQPKVLLGRRHAGHKFMPGKFVFPGGRIEAQDRNMQAATELHPDTQAKLLERVAESSAELARGFALAAVREMAEETGLLLGIKNADAPKTPADDWSVFAEAKVFPDLAQMHFIARAITPPKRPKRFDTRFFTADATLIAHKIEGVVGKSSELVEVVWIPIEDAKQLDIPTITGVILEELAARVAAGMAHSLPVPFYFMQDQKFFRDLL
jgi:8-oxo-dGTP pyrophosphatase MutT (NUDIX family)